MTLESTIEAYLVKRVEALGGYCLKGAIPGRRFIDRICVFPNGVTGYAEVKRPKKGRKEAHQIATIKRLTELGHIARFMCNQTDVDGFIIACRAKVMADAS